MTNLTVTLAAVSTPAKKKKRRVSFTESTTTVVHSDSNAVTSPFDDVNIILLLLYVFPADNQNAVLLPPLGRLLPQRFPLILIPLLEKNTIVEIISFSTKNKSFYQLVSTAIDVCV